MAAGCKNPNAANYSGSADSDNFSCVYMLKNQGNCHWFRDIVPQTDNDRSFTLSYSVPGKSWVFFHDYTPDMYFHTRDQLWTAKTNSIYKHNDGVPGLYYQGNASPKKPFFIDVIFRADFDLLLETVNWVSEYLQTETDQPFNTLTHVTVWNSHQHSGRVPMDKIAPGLDGWETRKTKGQWVFNDFRNILIAKGSSFLQDIFHNYLLKGAAADVNQAWYDKEILTDNWFCVRFEFDNSANAKLIIHDTTIQAIKSDR